MLPQEIATTVWKHAGFLSILLLFPSFQMSWEVPCLLHYLAVLYSHIASCVVKHCHSVATKLPLHCRLILFSLKSWCRRCSSGGMKGLCMFHASSRASWGRENKRRSSTGSSPRPCGIDSPLFQPQPQVQAKSRALSRLLQTKRETLEGCTFAKT